MRSYGHHDFYSRIFRAALCLIATGTALAAAQSVTLSPVSLSFPDQVVHTSSAVKKVTLKNGQKVALTITGITTAPVDFAQANTCPISPATLAAGKSCTISVTFTPSAIGSLSGSLTIVHNASNSPQSVALTGAGIAAVTATPVSIDFGNQATGKKSSATSVKIKNNQAVALTINSIISTLGDFADTTTCPLNPSTLAAGGSCTVSVSFTPALAGVRSAVLTISDNASNSPTVTLNGTGVVAATTNVSALSFGSQALGTSSPPQTVTLTNNQSSSLTISSVKSSLSDFTVNACPATLAAGASCAVSVTFTPKAAGARSGTLTFKDSANNSPQTVSLSGTGGSPVLSSIAVAPASTSVLPGATQAFVATGTFSDGSKQTITSSVTWTSSAPAIASVTSTGVATGISPGVAIVIATSGLISGSSSLTVIPPVLTSLAVTPATASIVLGSSQQFTAIGTYNDGSTQNLTTSASWSSSATAVATVSGTGVASSSGQGTSTITATSGAISGSATLAVAPPVLVSLAISPADASFALGTTLPLKSTGTYTDGSTLDVTSSVTWSTADSAIASVNAQGVATSITVGGTTVTAASGPVSGTTTLTVSPAKLASIAITPAIPTIPLGTTQQFSATGTFTDGSTQDITGTVQWSSDAPLIATISNDPSTAGLAAALGTGPSVISAVAGQLQASTTLTVTAATLVSIAITPPNASIALGTKQGFNALGTFTDGTTQDLTSTATWTSDTPASATIDNNGLASGINLGSATISATSGGVNGSAGLAVTAAELVSIAITPPTVSTPLGTAQTFAAVGTYTDGTTQDVTQSGHWSSSNANAATVSNTPGSQGLASTLGTGTSTIAITQGGVSGSATMIVNPAALVSITLDPQTPSIPLGTAQQFTATGTYTDGTSQDLTGIALWDSSSATVAVVGTTGLAISSGAGTATISATQGSVTTSTTLTVGQAAIVSIAVSPATSTISLGTTQQFTATGTYTDGNTQDVTASVTWSSSSTAVAAVSATGLASSVTVGSTTITATSGSASGGAVLAIAPPVPVSLAVTPASASIAFGAQQQFQAFLTYSDGEVQNVTSLVTWTSSAPAVATVGPTTGLAISVTAGSANIYANSNSAFVAGGALSVQPPGLISIAITPASITLALSHSQQFTATGTFADSSQQDLSATANWNSSNSAAVSMSNAGLGTALAFGTATMTATSGTVTGSTPVVVPNAPVVPSNLFDMTINKATTPWPTDIFYGQRLLGTGTLWGNIEDQNGAYHFQTLDRLIGNAQAHNVDLVYTFLGVPPLDSSNQSNTLCSSWPGSCEPPNDLNSDGTGTNLHWKNFVEAIAKQEATKIKYWELWNEPNVASYANNKTWTMAQWIRMASDARPIILGHNPNAVIISPGIGSGTGWLTSFLAAGGGSYVDIIGFHGYANPPESVLPLITAARSAANTGGAGTLPLWNTEASWGANTVLPDLDMQAASVARLYVLNAANNVARFYWYGWDFSNRGTLWQPNTATGCTTPNNGGFICPAGIAYGQVYNWIAGAVLSGCSTTGTTWTCSLARPDGYLAQIMWDSSQTCSGGICQTVAYTPPAQFTKYRDLNGGSFSLSGSATVPLGAKPIILENQ